MGSSHSGTGSEWAPFTTRTGTTLPDLRGTGSEWAPGIAVQVVNGPGDLFFNEKQRFPEHL